MLPQSAVRTSIRTDSIRQMPKAPSQPVGAEQNALAQSMQMMGAVMSFPRNSEIFGENEPADYVYRVISGSVRTYKILSDGRRQITRSIRQTIPSITPTLRADAVMA